MVFHEEKTGMTEDGHPDDVCGRVRADQVGAKVAYIGMKPFGSIAL